VYEKEALAILEALKRWRHYFLGGKLIIRSNHQSLKFITDQRVSEGIQHKLMLKLLEHDYAVEYRKGSTNRAVDALSRQYSSINTISVVQPKWLQEISESYVSDPVTAALVQQYTITPPEPASNHTFHQGILRYQGRIMIGSNKAIQDNIFLALHCSAIGGHSGMRATYQRIKCLFHWPGLKQWVQTKVAACPVCQRSKHENCKYPGLLDPLPIPDMAWTHISMDFIEGLPKSNGKDVILVVVDRLTKYAHFIALSHPYTVQTSDRCPGFH
jgi:hypothetical protein